jgi:release factor glutamine methyltransferase
MTVREALREGHLRLGAGGIETPQLDASLLLAEALGVGRERLLASLPDEVGPDALARYRAFVERREGGQPVSYIRGRKEFYGLVFAVGPAVLVPRPETELLVERALALAGPGARLHDACTGSGCVAVAAAHERPDLDVSASDISEAAAAVFMRNCSALLGRALQFTLSDLLDRVTGAFDLITANPPYLRDAEVARIKNRGWPEPALALAGGPDGLDLARRLIETAPQRLSSRGALLLEADPEQMPALEAALRARGFSDAARHADLAGLERIIEARWRS